MPATNAQPKAEGLNLKQVAQELGVHYMTAYRYVRNGRLHAVKAGTEWRVRPEAVAEFRAAAVRPDRTTDGGDPDRWAERLIPPLSGGDEPAAMRVLEEALGSGHDLAFCFLDVIAPAMAHIDRRAANSASTAPAALATVVAQRLVARLGSRFRRPGRTKGTVLLGAPTGEHHHLALSMIADLVRTEGYGVMELGTNAPPEAFAEIAMISDRLAVVGVGITTADRLEAARATVCSIRVVAPDVPIMLGGQAVLNGDMAALLGADGWASDGRQAVQAIEQLAATRRERGDGAPRGPR